MLEGANLPSPSILAFPSSSSMPHHMRTSKTVSTSTPETAQGTHVFDIFGYSQHIGMNTDWTVRSGPFSIGGHEWELRFCPNGFWEGQKDCVVVFLVLLSQSHKVRASCDLRMVNQTTGLPSSLHKVAPRVFNSDDQSSMVLCFLKRRSVFEESAYLRDDRLTIECMVTVMNEPQVPETKSFPKIEVPPPDITEHLGKLLEEKEGLDVTFSVGGETFTAHKIVLAMRSPVLKAELYGPMREARAQLVTIEDMQPAVFKALLHFIYTDSLPDMDDHEGDDNSEIIRHLLVAADRYAMERLKLVCQSILCENLNVETVATTLALADQHNCDRLKDACLEFITCSNAIDAVVATQGYKNLKRASPSFVADALEKTSRFRRT